MKNLGFRRIFLLGNGIRTPTLEALALEGLSGGCRSVDCGGCIRVPLECMGGARLL